jgi:hypothetical protein
MGCLVYNKTGSERYCTDGIEQLNTQPYVLWFYPFLIYDRLPKHIPCASLVAACALGKPCRVQVKDGQ